MVGFDPVDEKKVFLIKVKKSMLTSRFRNPILKSFIVMNKANVRESATIWKTHLPFVCPFYAVKSNVDIRLLRWITEVFDEVGFDCASIKEMQTVRSISKTSQILYAHPCKTKHDIIASVQFGTQLTVVDSPEELQKLHETNWKGEILIRILVPDQRSKHPFGKKFGAPIACLPMLFTLSKQYMIPIRGLSFHVGSECEDPTQFSQALSICKQVMDMGKQVGIEMDIIDIGGGFIPGHLPAVAACIQTSRKTLFHGKPLRWIAEPGRFLSATSQTLYTPIIGKKCHRSQTFQYTLHESIYGQFSNIKFDRQQPVFEVIYAPQMDPTKTYPTILYGHTCDGADIIHPCIQLPILNTGDWLKIENMGAYTNVTASEFNGFSKPDIIYIE